MFEPRNALISAAVFSSASICCLMSRICLDTPESASGSSCDCSVSSFSASFCNRTAACLDPLPTDERVSADAAGEASGVPRPLAPPRPRPPNASAAVTSAHHIMAPSTV